MNCPEGRLEATRGSRGSTLYARLNLNPLPSDADTIQLGPCPPGRAAVAAADVSAQQLFGGASCCRLRLTLTRVHRSTAAWGLVAACCVFISSPASFYALRFALGVAEAGAFPGCWFVCGQVRCGRAWAACASDSLACILAQSAPCVCMAAHSCARVQDSRRSHCKHTRASSIRPAGSPCRTPSWKLPLP